jgi:beta-glucanase (GH16 family)
VDWQPKEIVWYIDGVERRRYTHGDHIPAEPMYLLLNLAVGGTWPCAPTASTLFPANYEVDYVRVWSSRPAMGART